MPKIENCIIDFGGVLYKIDVVNTYDAFLSLSSRREELKKQKVETFVNDELFLRYESGLITTTDFMNEAKKKFSLNIDDTEFKKAWNSTLVQLNDFALEAVRKLKKRFNLYLLSNTNEIHHQYFAGECAELFSCFNKCYFSYLMGVRKPDLKIFEMVLNDNNLKPEVTAFLDDSAINLNAACKLSLKTYLINDDFSILNFADSVS